MERAASQLDKFGFGNFGGFFARTSFEERELNDMLDLLDGANPTDLSNAGLNLAKAKESLNAAAEELSKFVKGTVWRGAAATEFERYGTALAGYAWDLGSFANVVGTQMTVAATGLTSVRSAKPPRDTRADRRRPKDFPVTEQKDDNPEYKRAVQVEENRQEGINQMNRLASFYAVSEQSLAGVKEPELPKMLGTAVPPPKWGDWEKSPDSGAPAERTGWTRRLRDRALYAPTPAALRASPEPVPMAWLQKSPCRTHQWRSTASRRCRPRQRVLGLRSPSR